MIRFFKELYLTAFTILFRLPGRTPLAKIGTSIAAITLVEGFILIDISSYIDILIGEKFLLSFSKPVIVIIFVALGFLNQYLLYIRGYGIKFEREFDKLNKYRRILLVTSCVVLLLVTIVFFFYSTSAYQHFFHIIPK
jgi:hypothetical protein